VVLPAVRRRLPAPRGPGPGAAQQLPALPDVLLRAERNGFDNILCPSGYALGIDSLAFAAGVAP
jgi:alkanesulfonate monooxygenase